ncbi:hypothetical protein C8A03DRAFT_18433 [Achaetomium macrosporum]|uniref:Uncharacterized protein n=1 Tax=Achaetomium macrosporum TaxID=79813 RepID=A0AAN7HBB7_9PEZI|nr:hypothetical protein C8A03DRAFT_18433 [Achaetomium macrosporum]
MRSHLWLLAASGHVASANWLLGQELDHRGALIWPRETGSSDHGGVNGWTPRPTEAPFVAGRADGLELARRREEWVKAKRQTSNTWLNDQTCGWAAGTESEAFTCPSSSQCSTNSDNVVGCTSPGGPSPFFTVCFDYAAVQAGACESIGAKTGCCMTSTLGACITYLWPGDTPRSMYRCYTAQTIVTMLDVPGFVETTSSSTASTTSSTSSTTTSSSTTTPAPAETTTDAPSSNTSGGGSNTGAIVGGVVGGVAGIALIAGAIAWVIIRNRNKSGNVGSGAAYSAVAPGDTSYPGAGGAVPPSTYAPSSASPNMSQAGYFSPGSLGTALQPGTPYLASTTPPPPGAYDPRMSYYDPSKPPGHMSPPAGYAAYPGAPEQQPAHQVVSELDGANVPSGHQGNPVEMADNSTTQR